jgi:hypothetical protein
MNRTQKKKLKNYLDRYASHLRLLQEFMYQGDPVAVRKIFLVMAYELFKAAQISSGSDKKTLCQQACYYSATARAIKEPILGEAVPIKNE